MTKEDIIRMAHEAGLYLATDVNWMPIIGFEYAEKFAKLVAASEREACAKICDDMVLYTGYDCAYAIRAREQA